MFTASQKRVLQKGAAAGLAGIFMLAAMGMQEAAAATRHHKPQATKMQKQGPAHRQAANNNACVQTASDSFAQSLGYSNANVMRRATALAYVRSEEGLDNDIIAGIALANADTGADFDLLVMVSSLESRLGIHDAPINMSSNARGPFQYLPAPFLTLFNWFGADYAGGVYAKAARQIAFDEKKNALTGDPALTAQLLTLRSEPYFVSYIKGVEVMKDVRPLLRAILGRDATRTDIYIAHVLGLEQDKPLIRALRHSPKAAAADIFPLEASKEDNRSLFYKGKKKLSIQQFYNQLGAKTATTIKNIDKLVYEGLAARSCLPPMRLVRPTVMVINIPENMPLPSTIFMPKPPENIPFEPDAIQRPTPAPEPVPSEVAPPPMPIYQPRQFGPNGDGP